MEATGSVIDRSRALRLALLGLVAGGAAVVCGMLLGGSHASASDDPGVLDGLLGGTTQVLVDTTTAVGGTATQTVEIASAVAAPVVAPIAPVIQPVAAPVTQLVDAVPTLSSVVTPVAAQVDGLVAAVPIVRDLASAPATSVVVPVVGAVDDVLEGATDAVVAPPLTEQPIAQPPTAGSDAIATPAPVAGATSDDVAAEPSTRVALADDSLGLASPDQTTSAEQSSVGGQQVLAITRVVPAQSGSLSATEPHRDAVPAPIDERGSLTPAAGASAPGATVADATHAAHRSAAAVLRAAADDDALPASVVGDHDSSPD